MNKYILYMAAALLALSCTQSAVDPLSDEYPKPTTYTFTRLEEPERTKDENGKSFEEAELFD